MGDNLKNIMKVHDVLYQTDIRNWWVKRNIPLQKQVPQSLWSPSEVWLLRWRLP